jgi:hypothetical protein
LSIVRADGVFSVLNHLTPRIKLIPVTVTTDLAKERSVSVDYAGLADDYAAGILGTQTTGTVTERPLSDGRAEIHVRLHTKNALTWVVDDPADFNEPLLFGYRAPDLVPDGQEPALGESFLDVKFINTAPGDPLPDLIQLVVAPQAGQELVFLAFRARANGPLRGLFGVEDGTPGRVTVVQTGLFMTPFRGAVADGFPVERIELHVVGQ